MKRIVSAVLIAMLAGVIVAAPFLAMHPPQEEEPQGDILADGLEINYSWEEEAECAAAGKCRFPALYHKLSTDLVFLLNESLIPDGIDQEALLLEMEALHQYIPDADSENVGNGSVYVYITLRPWASPEFVDHYALNVTGRDETCHLLTGWVRVREIETLAMRDEVCAIHTVMPSKPWTGEFSTEGDRILHTDALRTTLGLNGSGIRIGIISDGTDHLADAQESGDVPGNVHVLRNNLGGDEGTAMLEIVHDIAPDADLYFHDAGDSVIAFNEAIDALVDANCTVICDDIGWTIEPFFEDGIVATHVSEVLKNNSILFISAAGNAAEQHYQGAFHNNANGWHDFSEGNRRLQFLFARLPPGARLSAILEWNDTWGSAENDYDLYMFDTTTGRLLALSESFQDGNATPLEALVYTNTAQRPRTVMVSVRKISGENRTLELFLYPERGASVFPENINAGDSVFGHAAVSGVVSVGAINANEHGWDMIQPYSSHGPSTVVAPFPVSRRKPDICGIDGVTVSGVGFRSPFYGTSAAAPHIAGMSALVWGAFPDLTGDEIRELLFDSAVDIGPPGWDVVFGHGRADGLRMYEFAFLHSVTAANLTSRPLPEKAAINFGQGLF